LNLKVQQWHGFFYIRLVQEGNVNGSSSKNYIMKKYSFLPLLAILISLSSCEIVGGIFKAGIWAGVIMVVLVVGVIIFILAKLFGGGRR
jgi:Ni,Fe-hydrogenase III small subunit